MIFSNDTEVIVIRPIKKVVEIIKILAENPLKSPVPPEMKSEQGNQMKTQMLELTIFKIGTLLQRGFGQFGSVVVSESLTQQHEGIDLGRPGKQCELVFSMCRIRQFTETTECLQDEIIVFVNKIVKIIHECTKRWDGKPAKNFGEKYLLTWKIPSFSEAIDSVKEEEKGNKKPNPLSALFKSLKKATPKASENLDSSNMIEKKDAEEKKRLVGGKKKKGDKENSKSETAPPISGYLPNQE